MRAARPKCPGPASYGSLPHPIANASRCPWWGASLSLARSLSLSSLGGGRVFLSLSRSLSLSPWWGASPRALGPGLASYRLYPSWSGLFDTVCVSQTTGTRKMLPRAGPGPCGRAQPGRCVPLVEDDFVRVYVGTSLWDDDPFSLWSASRTRARARTPCAPGVCEFGIRRAPRACAPSRVRARARAATVLVAVRFPFR